MPVSMLATEGTDLDFLCSSRPVVEKTATRPLIGIADLFAGCGAMTVGAIEGARRAGVAAELLLAVDHWLPALEVIESTFGIDSDRVAGLDLSGVLEEETSDGAETEERIVGQAADTDLLLAGPPCQGHSALNNHTRHDDARNDLYLAVARVARLIEPRAVIVENVRGVGRDRRKAVSRCADALKELGYTVKSQTLDLYALGAPQRRIRHVLVASRDKTFDFEGLPEQPGRSVEWAIRDLEDVDGRTLFDTASAPSEENEKRMKWLLDEDEFDLPNPMRPACHHDAHSYVSMYGRLRWDEPAQTITSGFGSMGQGRFVHPGAPRTLTPHEAARLQFLPDFMDFSPVEQRTDLATMIGNAVPPIMTMAIVQALIEQGLLSSPATDLT
jgi:DNA (cytosine-5)-methyltransferase 1